MSFTRKTLFVLMEYSAIVSFANCFHLDSDQYQPEVLPEVLVQKSSSPSGKVLLIGVDGLCPDALQKKETPHIDALVAEGAYSFAARTGKKTISFPSWSTYFTGVWEPKHGVFANPGEDAVIKANFETYPSFFTRAELYQPELSTVSLVSWGSINDFIIKSLDENIKHPYEEKKQEADSHIAEDAVTILREKNPDLMFIYFVNVDYSGHTYGYGAQVPEYLASVKRIDSLVGQILNAQRSRPDYAQETWLTMLVSDHCGKGKSHDGVGEQARTVPFIMHGPSVQPGEIIPPPTSVDVAPTALTHLGIAVKPEWELDGKVVGLR